VVAMVRICLSLNAKAIILNSNRGAWVAPLVGCITGCIVYDTMVFSGGESPLNYRWPTRQEFIQHMRGKGKRVHNHVTAQAKIKH